MHEGKATLFHLVLNHYPTFLEYPNIVPFNQYSTSVGSRLALLHQQCVRVHCILSGLPT